jgi:accessory gene regulator B
VESIIFYVAYFILRVYAGGYHADSPLTCFFLSIILLIPFLLAIKYQYMWNVPWVFFALLIGAIVILVLIAPVGTKNKMLDDLEKVVYRRRLFRNLAIASVIGVTLFLLSFNEYSAAVLCGILLTTSIALAGKIKLSLQG